MWMVVVGSMWFGSFNVVFYFFLREEWVRFEG